MMSNRLLAKKISFLPTFLMILGLPLIVFAQQDSQDDQTQNLIAGHKILRTIQNEYTRGVKQILEDRTRGSYWITTSSLSNPASTLLTLNSYDEIENQWKKNKGFVISGRFAQGSDGKLWNAPTLFFLGHLRFCDGEGCRSLTEEEKRSIPISSDWHSSRDFISAIFPSQDNRLWFAIGNRLIAYNNQKWETVLTISIKEEPRAIINAGLQDKEGYIWLGAEKSIVRFDERTGESKLYSNPNKFVQTNVIYEDREERIWFANSDGQVRLYNKKENTWTTYILKEHIDLSLNNFNEGKTEIVPTPTFGIRDIYQDKAGQMIFATGNGLVVFNEENKRWHWLTNSALLGEGTTSIIEDSKGRIWIGTDKGIVILAP